MAGFGTEGQFFEGVFSVENQAQPKSTPQRRGGFGADAVKLLCWNSSEIVMRFAE